MLGDGSRFQAGVSRIEHKEGLGKARASAIMAEAGRRKYGAKKMAHFSSVGRQRASRGEAGE